MRKSFSFFSVKFNIYFALVSCDLLRILRVRYACMCVRVRACVCVCVECNYLYIRRSLSRIFTTRAINYISFVLHIIIIPKMAFRSNSSHDSIQGVPLKVFIEYSYVIFCTRTIVCERELYSVVKSNSDRERIVLQGLFPDRHQNHRKLLVLKVQLDFFSFLSFCAYNFCFEKKKRIQI